VVTTVCTEYKDGYITMGKESVFAEIVRSAFLELNRGEIELFADSYRKQTEPIKNTKSYIRTSLFRNHLTCKHQNINRVNIGMKFADPKEQEFKSGRNFSQECKPKSTRFANFPQRTWDFKEVERVDRAYQELKRNKIANKS